MNKELTDAELIKHLQEFDAENERLRRGAENPDTPERLGMYLDYHRNPGIELCFDLKYVPVEAKGGKYDYLEEPNRKASEHAVAIFQANNKLPPPPDFVSDPLDNWLRLKKWCITAAAQAGGGKAATPVAEWSGYAPRKIIAVAMGGLSTKQLKKLEAEGAVKIDDRNHKSSRIDLTIGKAKDYKNEILKATGMTPNNA